MSRIGVYDPCWVVVDDFHLRPDLNAGIPFTQYLPYGLSVVERAIPFNPLASISKRDSTMHQSIFGRHRNRGIPHAPLSFFMPECSSTLHQGLESPRKGCIRIWIPWISRKLALILSAVQPFTILEDSILVCYLVCKSFLTEFPALPGKEGKSAGLHQRLFHIRP